MFFTLMEASARSEADVQDGPRQTRPRPGLDLRQLLACHIRITGNRASATIVAFAYHDQQGKWN